MHLGVAIVAGDMMHTQTARDIIKLVGYEIARGSDVTVSHHNSSLLHEARQAVAKDLVEHGCDWILFVDSDMRLPQNAVHGMLRHCEQNTSIRVIAANCSKRRRPIGPTARKRSRWLSGGEDLEAIWPTVGNEDLERAETVGFGVMLIRADVFQMIEWPWFEMPWIESAQRCVGEDVFFCGRLFQAEIPLWIDHGLSWAVKHIGNYEFGMRDVLNEKALAEAGAWEGRD